MNRTKVKKTKASGGQTTISKFFSSQNQKATKNDLLSSTESSISSLTKTDTLITDAKSPPFRLHSPSERSILEDIENLHPSSPDLLVVPETPNSQVRPPQSPSAGQTCLQSLKLSRGVPSPRKPVLLSPVCRSPQSNNLSVQRVVREEGGGARSGSGLCGSAKRLLSPPEESRNAKRPNTVISLSPIPVISPRVSKLKVTMLSVSSEQSNKLQDCSRGTETHFSYSRMTPMQLKTMSGHTLGKWPKHQEGDGRNTDFTAIAEQKSAEVQTNSLLHASQKTDTSRAHVAEVSAQMVTGAPNGDVKSSREETSITSEDRNKTSSDEQRAAEKEEHTGVMSECPMDECLDESWFAKQMDHNEVPVMEKSKSKKPRKVPDHVILSGGLNNRYWVMDVVKTPGNKTLTISCSKSLHPTEKCVLKDGWESTPVGCGDVVHVEGRRDVGSWLVDRDQGFLVLLPDSLISGTSISSSIRCMRRAVLGDLFKSFDGGSKQMLNGTMVHEVFQRAAKAKDFSLEKLSMLANEALHSPRYLGDMYSLGVCQEEMKQELCDYLPSLELWAKKYLSSPMPKAIPLKTPSKASGGCCDAVADVTVAELTDIEENVWSPRFGLKGKIDVTARIRIQRPQISSRRCSGEKKTVPLELKTGRESNSIEHRSQVILYTLMSLERYNPDAGLLLYLKTGNMHLVAASRMDSRELLKLRNTLVYHIHNLVIKDSEGSRLVALPEIVTNRQTCQYCPQRRNCALYERALDPGAVDTSEEVLRSFLQEETGHLTLPHLNYFSHWVMLCCLEGATMEAKNSRKHVWLQTPEEREKSGSCVGNLQLKGPVASQSEGVFLHHFQRSSPAAHQSLTNIGLASRDRIVVSDQEGRLVGLATGHLCEVSRMSVRCTLDRNLSQFRDVLFRLDGDEGVVGPSMHLCNLSKLMESSQDSDRLRKLIVDLQLPEFISNLSSVLPREAKDSVAEILRGLNKPQKQAMKKVLLSKDYTLIVGMPGTGKTTTICTLVRILHACGFSVLLTSYTNSAVDNILLKLKRFQVGFLRLGQGQKVHPDILPFMEESVRKKCVHTLSELEQLYNKELVVATTCMGIKHPLFTHRRFDFCIVDEASQISQPICLGPLFYAKKFVLVGDHQQLAPIVQNQQARSLGMDESLFKRLEVHSEAVVQLNVQYRMSRQIMSLSNSLMYDGRLECGSERTASALLGLPFLLAVQSELSCYGQTHPQHDLAWIHATLLPSNPVCFLDCSMVPALESMEQGGVSNHTEAALIHLLLSLLIKAGCKPADIGVIAPYRQQLKCISGLLQSSAFIGVEVNTVDRYQGRDKSLIVLSFVKSTAEEGNLGELLKDWRRLNVAITRAKHKLLMVGSATTLRRYAPVEKLLDHLQKEDMIIQLPPAAHLTLPSMHL